MGLPEDQNTGHNDEREEVVRDQEVAIMLAQEQGTRYVELDSGLC